jgi:tetratricopeptide (TPR) repeat protein
MERPVSDNIQPLESIAAAGETAPADNVDPIDKEYQEGKNYLQQKNYGQAAVALHNALLGYEEKQDSNGVANASNQLGHLCLAREDFTTALKHYQRAFEICDESNDRMSVLAVLHKMVIAHRAEKNLDQAIKTSLDILDHYQDNRDPQGTVQTLEVMAEIYLEDEDPAKAADTYRTIASIHKNFKHENIASSYIKKAERLEG